MKLRVTFDLDDLTLRALNHRVGQPGRAGREDAEAFIRSELDATFDDLVADLLAAEAEDDDPE